MGDVGLGLIVVVVAHEVDHRIIGEELLELLAQLGRKRLVGGHDQRGHLAALDDVCHSEGFARPGDAQKRLVAHAVFYAFGKRVYGLGLVAAHLVGRHDLELVPGLAMAADDACLRLGVAWVWEHNVLSCRLSIVQTTIARTCDASLRYSDAKRPESRKAASYC